MTKQTFTLSTPDGVEHRRTSDKHVYVCASIGQVPAADQRSYGDHREPGTWAVISWHRSAQKAPKNLYGYYDNLKLVEVDG